MEVFLLIVLPFLVAIGSFCGFLAFLKMQRLQDRLETLEHRFLEGDGERAGDADRPARETKPAPEADAYRAKVTTSEPAAEARKATVVHKRSAERADAATGAARAGSGETGGAGIDWESLVRQYWMVILGGICLVFAGVFLVRYSIEHGFLGPTARFVIGLLFGASLIAGGEWLRRSGRLAAGVHAALVAAGVLVVYSAFLVGLHVYALVSAQVAFACMAVVSAFSMLLALKHGPIMAGMGLLGAYLVPVLVRTDSGHIEAALLYSLVVTVGSLSLQRYVYRSWLWWGTWTGALGWFLLSLEMPADAQGVRALYLAALAYAGVALPFAGLLLRRIDFAAQPQRHVAGQLTAVYAVLTVAMILLLRIEHLNELSYPAITALPVIAMLVARHNLPMLRRLPWITVLPFFVDLFSLELHFIDWNLGVTPMASALQTSYVTMLMIITVAAVLIGGRETVRRRSPGYWGTIAAFTPLCALLLAYIKVTGFGGGLEWGVAALLPGVLYGYLLDRWRRRQGAAELEAVLSIANQAAISLACFMVFSEVTLTLVLSVQLVGLALLDSRLRLPVLPVLVKVLLSIIVIRLTANPWILFYEVSSEVLLFTYAGCLLACLLASALARKQQRMDIWLNSAAAHLLVLTLAVCTRYMLYGRDIFAMRFNLTEASIYVCSWAAIGLVYAWKADALAHHRAWYRGIALLHIAAAALVYIGYNLLLHNPLWSRESISAMPVFNLLLAGYGLPVVLAALVYRRIEGLQRAAGFIATVGLYMFVTLEIRHLWNGGIVPGMPVREGELYTYSLAWLLLSVAMLLYGAYRGSSDAQRAGMAALVLVIAKVFLWDMRDLDGLWRVVSFLGLGLSLLGIAYLFNRYRIPLGGRRTDGEEQTTG